MNATSCVINGVTVLLPFPDTPCGETKIMDVKALTRHLSTKSHFLKVQKFLKVTKLSKASREALSANCFILLVYFGNL